MLSKVLKPQHRLAISVFSSMWIAWFVQSTNPVWAEPLAQSLLVDGPVPDSFKSQPSAALTQSGLAEDDQDMPGKPYFNKSNIGFDAQETNLIRTRLYKYIGNGLSLKFHRPSCPFAKVMGREHRIFFKFRRDAVESAFLPCRYCLPPNWKSVSLKITSLESQAASDNSRSLVVEDQKVPKLPELPVLKSAPTQNFGQ